MRRRSLSRQRTENSMIVLVSSGKGCRSISAVAFFSSSSNRTHVEPFSENSCSPIGVKQMRFVDSATVFPSRLKKHKRYCISFCSCCAAATMFVFGTLSPVRLSLFFYPLSVLSQKAFKIFSLEKTRCSTFRQYHLCRCVFLHCAFDELFAFRKIFSFGSAKSISICMQLIFNFLFPHSRCLIIFPLTVFGSSSLNSTIVPGYLYGVVSVPRNLVFSFFRSSVPVPLVRTNVAFTTRPLTGSAQPLKPAFENERQFHTKLLPILERSYAVDLSFITSSTLPTHPVEAVFVAPPQCLRGGARQPSRVILPQLFWVCNLQIFGEYLHARPEVPQTFSFCDDH